MTKRGITRLIHAVLLLTIVGGIVFPLADTAPRLVDGKNVFDKLSSFVSSGLGLAESHAGENKNAEKRNNAQLAVLAPITDIFAGADTDNSFAIAATPPAVSSPPGSVDRESGIKSASPKSSGNNANAQPLQLNLYDLPATESTQSDQRPKTASHMASSIIQPVPTGPGYDPPMNFLGPSKKAINSGRKLQSRSLMCRVELRENKKSLVRQSIGCTQPNIADRNIMLLEIANESANENPNMKYALAVRIEGYKNGYPVLHTRMLLTGMFGNTVGKRQYESVVISEPHRKQTLLAFNVDADEYEVNMSVSGRK